jgi:ABC-2 type transport system ATP-binding protein
MDNLLDIQGLCKHYGGFELRDVDLKVPSGAVVGFIGANGAGKTTTIKAALGLIAADSGSIRLFGRDIGSWDAACETMVKQRVGVVFDACSYPDAVSVGDVGAMAAASYPGWDAAGFESMAAGFGLPAERKMKELSRGMGMKLMMAVALSHGADLLVLDEATAGLDPLAREEVLDILRGFMEREGRGILMSSHITSDLEKIADYLVCLDGGRVVFSCEKDAITEMAGIARCRAEQFEEVAGSGLFETGKMRYFQHEYGTDVLVDDRAAFAKAFPGIALDRATIDDYMALCLKGSAR